MKKIYIALALLVAACAVAYWRHSRPVFLGEGYLGEAQGTVWSSTAEVREPVQELKFGDRVGILSQKDNWDRVRTAEGRKGWIESRALLDSDLWQKAAALETKARGMPVEAQGHTRVLANLHVEPGREAPRIRQLTKDVPVLLLGRQVADIPAAKTGSDEEESANAPAEEKKEDWWLVRAQPKQGGEIAGWVLGRFLDLQVPAPIPDYMNGASLRTVVWFVLNQAQDRKAGLQPEYVVFGIRGGEGQPCDFTAVRVFTWSTKHQIYETSFLTNDVCGGLPVTVSAAAHPGGDAGFEFANSGGPRTEALRYRMHHGVVHTVHQLVAKNK